MRPLDTLRPQTVARAHGTVLEVGIGTGLNFPHYPDTIDHLVGIEPDGEKLEHARDRAHHIPCSVELLDASAEALPFDDETFDTIVVTWVLCSIPNVDVALDELHRVLKTGGELSYVEHGQSPHALTRRFQHLAHPLWFRFMDGCHLTRTPRQLVDDAGFVHQRFKTIHDAFWNPFPMFAGIATKT